MGICSSKQDLGKARHNKNTKMKTFIATLALAATANAEADPALLYTGVAGVHHVAPVVAAPAVYTTNGLVAHANGAVTPDYTPAQKVAAATHLAAKGIHPVVHSGLYLGKREAEAKSDAYMGYGLPYAYGGMYSPYHIGGVHYLGKREAKSDAYLGYGLPYGGLYSPYTTLGGYHYLGKRDAEAKSDAYLGYGLPYGSVYSPYTTLGGYHYLGKRDAEAKSDAWGYGLPLAYGGVYSPYTTYGGYHFGKRDAEAKPW